VINFLTATQPNSIIPYCILALAALLEGPMTILVAGAGVAIGQLLPLPAYLSVVAGNLIADLGWYGLGRFGKMNWLERIGPKFGVNALDVKQLEKNIQKNGPRMLFLSKLTVGLPIPTLITIGLNRVAIRRWVVLWVLGELLKSTVLIAVGYLYADGINQAFGSVKTVLWAITIVFMIAIFISVKKYKKVRKPIQFADGFPVNQEENSERNRKMRQAKIEKINGLVLIPAYNEERSVASVVCSARTYLPVLVIDDGSTDDTAQEARLAGAMVLSNGQNQGKGAALQTGIQQALEQGYDFVITLDADGQHDPNEIPIFLKAYSAKQMDMIIGRRNFSLMPTVRRISNTLGTKIFSWAAGKPIPDNQSGYRLISRRLLEVLREPGERGFEFEVEMIVSCILHGYKMKWVPIRTIYGDEKSHIHPLRHAVKFMQVSLRTHRMLKKVVC